MREFLPFDKAIAKHGRQSGIYRIYASSNGKLLYVGKTEDFRRRMVQHRNMKPWFKNVAINFEPCPVNELNVRESEAIRSAAQMFKLHNISQNTNKPGTKQKVISALVTNPSGVAKLTNDLLKTINQIRSVF
jgi:predicted GIY-YIG superfamily endonuclease